MATKWIDAGLKRLLPQYKKCIIYSKRLVYVENN